MPLWANTGRVRRMSMYFFRLHNLRRAEEDKKKKEHQRRRGGRLVGCHRYTNALTLAPSRLFERPPLTPSDSLDEVALQIPRCSPYVNMLIHCLLWLVCRARGGPSTSAISSTVAVATTSLIDRDEKPRQISNF